MIFAIGDIWTCYI